ncbi:MAG TPA: type II secretion system F family protein [Phycisphaerales bacterium]|nr:type II secretion system F family protein [Phycisphaerales bacterium]
MPAATNQSETFVFLAAKVDGKKTLGRRAARDEAVLARELSNQKLILLRSWKLPAWIAGESDKPLGLKDQAEMTAQLAQLTSRGVPLVETLDVTAQAVSNKARPRVLQLKDMVSQGTAFSRAAIETGAFDEVTAAVFGAAERTGDLAGAADQLCRNAKRRLKIRETAQTLLFYPLIVLSISLMVGVFMLVVVVPQVSQAMQSAMGPDKQLPAITRTLAAVGIFLRTNPLTVIGAVLAAIIAIIFLHKPIARALARLTYVLPVMRDLVLAQETARFFSVMAALATGGVPLAEALGVANQTIHHPKLRTQLDTLRQSLIDGGLLRSLIDEVDALPVGTRRLLMAAERAGNLDEAFESLAEDHTDLVERLSGRFLAVLEPLLIVGIFFLIGGMILAIMAPMLALSRNAFG